MKKSKNEETQSHLMRICAWCTLPIAPGVDTFGFGAHASRDIDLEDKEGQFVTIKLLLLNKTTIALVLPEGSPAMEFGFDLFFITCSQECAEQLKEALELELDVYDVYDGSTPSSTSN
jgi:hypothetical protein